MTQTTGRVFDELAKMITNAAGVAEGLRAETEIVMRAQAERLLRELEIVQREEFEAVKEMAAKAREENERLESRIEELEARLKTLNLLKKRAPARGNTASVDDGAGKSSKFK
jgi:BMFP domain-containing protein YqiC